LTGVYEAVLAGHTDKIYCLALLPDGRVVSGSWDDTLRVWQPSTGVCDRVIPEFAKLNPSTRSFYASLPLGIDEVIREGSWLALRGPAVSGVISGVSVTTAVAARAYTAAKITDLLLTVLPGGVIYIVACCENSRVWFFEACPVATDSRHGPP
jgi:WD40 repeat protein